MSDEIPRLTLTRVAALCILGMVNLAFITYVYVRMRKLQFPQFKALTLTNKYLIVSFCSGIFALSAIMVSLPFFQYDVATPLIIFILGTSANVATWICTSVAVFASIFRYERIGMIFRGTRLFKLLQSLRFTTILLSCFAFAAYILGAVATALKFPETQVEMILIFYSVSTGIAAAFMMIVDVSLGIKMTILVLESVKASKISSTLRPRLYAGLTALVACDVLGIACVSYKGIEFGAMATAFCLLHVLASFHLLIALQDGIKAKKKQAAAEKVTQLSSVNNVATDNIKFESYIQNSEYFEN